MKQIVQNMKNGQTFLEELPVPKPGEGQVLIRTSRSLVSLGTEKMLVEFGKASLISKARQQPDKVKQVLDKIKSDGLLPTLEAVFNKLDQPLPLGYCNAGVVIETGPKVSEFSIGDRVVSNGNHAEYVCVPKNLVAKIPDDVSDEKAAFAVIGSIGLQGVRLINPTIGETIVVVGLGLIGLITAQLLKANGCRVIGYDLDEKKVEIAKQFGVNAFIASNDPVSTIMSMTNGTGTDGVVITASAKNNSIISQSAQMCRKRGRIVLVGVIGLDIQRSDFYNKELTFQVSCSYGPGRYDPEYEDKGNDYPLPFVRWTEKRNFETILDLIQSGALKIDPLITEIKDLDSFGDIYNNIGNSDSIASIIKYSPEETNELKRVISRSVISKSNGNICIIGAGNFTSATLLPALKNANAKIKCIVSKSGLTATTLAKKHGIADVATDYKQVLANKDTDLVMIITRHNLHAGMAVEVLEAGKHVFVEKPLALNNTELQQIIDAASKSDKTITVGFNRRFAPTVIKAKKLLGNTSTPMNIIATMNAGFIPKDVWLHDLEVGGGRIIGEACHYIDLAGFFTGSTVEKVMMSALGESPQENTDNAIITLKYSNGSQAVINYFANGHKAYSKERIEIFNDGKTIIIDNFRKMYGYGFRGFSKMSTKLDKGHKTFFKELTEMLTNGGEPLIPFDSIVNTTKASFAAIESLKEGKWIGIK